MIISLCSMESRVPFSAEMWWLDNWGVGGGWGWREQRRRLREIVTHLFTFGFLSHLRRLPKVPTPLTPDDLTRRCGSDNLLNYFLSRDFIGPASISALLRWRSGTACFFFFYFFSHSRFQMIQFSGEVDATVIDSWAPSKLSMVDFTGEHSAF